jgi:hypothetical protein
VAPPDSALVDPMPPETIVPQDITVHLTSVRLDLTMVWAQSGIPHQVQSARHRQESWPQVAEEWLLKQGRLPSAC